jgi:hypothetical protein
LLVDDVAKQKDDDKNKRLFFLLLMNLNWSNNAAKYKMRVNNRMVFVCF